MDVDEAQIDEGLYSRQLQVPNVFLPRDIAYHVLYFVRYVLGHEGVRIDTSG